MLNKINILFILLFLFGCTSVTNYEMDSYANSCKDHGGIREMNEILFPLDIDYVVCQDGKKIIFKSHI